MQERVERLHGVMTTDQVLEEEFEVRLSESSTLAFRIAYSVLRHREDAEDVAQEAFARAYRNFHRLRDRNRFRPWLVRMTWRLALDRLRADRRRTTRELAVEEPPHQPVGESAESRERAERLWEAIDALPEKLRVVVVLAGIEGHDMKEVSLLLGIPGGTVKSRLFSARQRLKESLQWTIERADR